MIPPLSYNARMDAATLVLMTTLLLILNGGVLGLVHRGLTQDVQPAAMDWRIGTLLIAGATVLFIAVEKLPPGFIFPAANFCLLSGIALYWRAMRRFCGLATDWRLAIPVVAGTFGTWWFAQIHYSHPLRVMVVSGLVSVMAFLSAWTIARYGARSAGVSRKVLTVLFCFIGLVSAIRILYFSFSVTVPANVLQSQAWINIVSILVFGTVPLIGTTAFIVMCVERIRRQWEAAAATDELTGLPNRRSISATAHMRFNAAQRMCLVEAFAVAVIDIDHFKSVNDRFGHDAGDAALVHLADVLGKTCRGPNMAGRHGGEEFVVLLDVANAVEAIDAAERIRRTIAESPITLSNQRVQISASIGVSVMSANDAGFEDILKRADLALYSAKRRGRNCVEFCKAL